MFKELSQRYYTKLDATMRSIVDNIASPVPDFGIMLRYPMGWVNEQGNPYNHPTGKRIRPMLLLLCVEAAGGNWHTALPAAAAVEFLHNFSLIHDDIEDSSPTRHGRPSVWKIWGIANAINTGDALFGLSHKALEGLSQFDTNPETVLKVWNIFNNTILELTRGQHLDMRFEHQDTVTVDEYISMISGKSAALVAACAQMGAMIATGDDDLAQSYAQLGYNLGVAFQIHDDILGIWGDSTVTGKSTATDIISRKKSLPVLYGLAQSKDLVHLYERETFTETEVQQAVQILNNLKAKDFAREKEAFYYHQAVAAIEKAQPQGAATKSLQSFADQLFQRKS